MILITGHVILTPETPERMIALGAELHDGLLRVSLPKHEAIKPRKITVG